MGKTVCMRFCVLLLSSLTAAEVAWDKTGPYWAEVRKARVIINLPLTHTLSITNLCYTLVEIA